jgi:hypothetical protein
MPPPPAATAEAPVSKKRTLPPPLPTTATTAAPAPAAASGTDATSLFSTLPPAEKPEEDGKPKLTDSARKRLLEAEMEAELEKNKRLAEQRRDSNTSHTGATASTLVSGGTAKPATPDDGIDQSRRFQDELTGENRGREQNAEVKKQRRWIAFGLLTLITIFLSITFYFSCDSISAAIGGLSASSSASASASTSVTTSASASAKPKTSSTAKPKSVTSVTPKPTTPIVTSSAPQASCTPVTQDWVDAQPWAAGRNGNDINKFSIRNWPKNLNCGKGDTLMKWVDAKNVDISACCQ